jgi:Restriction endonuclease XhoI
MALNLCDFETKTQAAIKTFWQSREDAKHKQQASGKADQGERAGVTGGKNMDGFAKLVIDLVKGNGLQHAEIHHQRAVLTLPGFFRPTKLWDMLVIDKGQLIAALEFKSQVGPSFGNNFNNRAEEAIGTSHDFWTAYREGAFGPHARPFLGWLMVVEDAPQSRADVKLSSPHFPVFPEFTKSSYLTRYDMLYRRLAQEHLYSTSSVIATPRSAVVDGRYSEMSPTTGMRSFVASLAGHIATSAAR